MLFVYIYLGTSMFETVNECDRPVRALSDLWYNLLHLRMSELLSNGRYCDSNFNKTILIPLVDCRGRQDGCLHLCR